MGIIPGFLVRKVKTEAATLRSVLDNVMQGLTGICRGEILHLQRVMWDHQQLESCTKDILTLSRILAHLARLQKSASSLRLDEVIDQLEELALDVLQTIAAEGRCPQNALARATLSHVVSQLYQAEAQLIARLDQPASPGVQSVLVSSDILHQARRSLFPPERMLVVAAHRSATGAMRLGATFDVTGDGPDTHRVHVLADPDKLGRALRAMDLTGTELGAWVHSHPGSGIAATTPSSIDLQQHEDWLRNYNGCLLSAIMVDDGYIRFWGSALESGQVSLRIIGPGVRQEENCVYRLAMG